MVCPPICRLTVSSPTLPLMRTVTLFAPVEPELEDELLELEEFEELLVELVLPPLLLILPVAAVRVTLSRFAPSSRRKIRRV